MIFRPLNLISRYGALMVLMLLNSCKESAPKEPAAIIETKQSGTLPEVQLVVLGTIQDAGSPQIGCEKECCRDLFDRADPERRIVSLGLIDNRNKKRYLLEATPDIGAQVQYLNHAAGVAAGKMPDGIFITHAHIGHYTGLMFLGKEAINASSVPVFTMARMAEFLETSGPWSQLVTQKNILLRSIQADSAVMLTPSISITPFLVPHRDEYSETVGFVIRGPEKKVLFIPDIDKWDRWETDIEEKIAEVDYAFVDATFYSGEEMNLRNIDEIPHPFVIESMSRLGSLPLSERQKVHFIHFNHTNPLLSPESQAYREVISRGFRVAAFGEKLEL